MFQIITSFRYREETIFLKMLAENTSYCNWFLTLYTTFSDAVKRVVSFKKIFFRVIYEVWQKYRVTLLLAIRGLLRKVNLYI